MHLSERLKLHSAGATIIHNSPFSELPAFLNEEQLSKPFIDKWVQSFYMQIGYAEHDNDFYQKVIAIKNEITPEVVAQLLGNFDWRTRQTGAYFAAIKNYTQFIDVIGVHLLKSEVCYAGGIYAFVMAWFNTDKCITYLKTYLDYYLLKPELWFDQAQVLEALKFLDDVNGNNNTAEHLSNWGKFLQNKPYWNKHIETTKIEYQIKQIKKIQEHK
ncbi:hypothetical protein FMM05_10075 [Flavobacterium zepuense]|uniref:Uncharacterized protein n=1 Tax=Flavobacterium zepuense TaxID=2593302 RepID=A0A552V313_9FLAO|nr:DUF6000 family protein [Flavobacterium zepuense]TRW24837.1 hypothetical protein FMM05_10075 [Flavobacterium zepuense]